jgi:hypothetical protein
VGDLLEARQAADLADIKKLIMAWLGATERRRRARPKKEAARG